MLWKAVQEQQWASLDIAGLGDVQPQSIRVDMAVPDAWNRRRATGTGAGFDIVRHMTKLPDDRTIVKSLTKSAVSSPPIGDLMRRAQQRLVAFLDGALREAGYSDIRSAHVSVMATIDSEGTRLATLAERGGRTKQATAQLATQLLDRGYVTLVPDTADGRAKLYLVTERGRKMLDAAEIVVAGYEQWLCRLLGPESIEQLRLTLNAIADDPTPS